MSNTIERALEKQRKLAEEELAAAARKISETKTAEPTQPLQPSSLRNQNQPLENTTAQQHSAEPKKAAPVTQDNPNQRIKATRSNGETEKHTSKPTDAPEHDGIDITIDTEQLDRDGMVAPTEKFTKIKEQYRYIKRPLLNNAFGDNASLLKHPNLVLVSSSYPGEGKTFTAINLAISMVLEQDRTVLLVDADVINPTLSSRFSSRDKQGLLDYLKGDTNVQDIILNTNIPNFKIITAGKSSHHSNEMIASDKMKQLMSELSERYPDRVVIFDTAPLLGASETHVLSQMVGQAVIVVEEERTTHSQLERALSMLNPDLAVGLVLNKSKSRRRDYYGYYYAQK